ncbi:MAG: hypothetical protein KatS3mg031_3151 [Chitinophagales bacterium]|nr:MAG: hypothetical protein KatS3mg031_3151 [Chitinophagales bacterium]
MQFVTIMNRHLAYYLIGLLGGLLVLQPAKGQQTVSSDSRGAASPATVESLMKRLRLSAYGVVNYYAFDWDTWKDKRNAIDPERLNTYVYYDFNDRVQFKAEIEFEHGGTGSTMSFDPLEEFGEFEEKIEKGGQVILEQINVLFKIHPWLNVRLGKMRFYMGNASKQDQPREYFTAYRSEVENTILPLGWYETGIELSGDIALSSSSYPKLAYKLYWVSGLDNSGFSSANWIRRGYQKRFEKINADHLATALRLDYIFAKDSEIGISLYAGNTNNRPKDDFDLPAWLLYGDVHFTIEQHPWRARAYGVWGHLQNSEALSEANRNLSNNLGVKRTPVGAEAAGAYIEYAYDIFFPLGIQDKQLYLFSRAEWYDSMFKTEGNISDNPRYERKVLTAGINYFPLPTVVLKAHYAWRILGSGEHENTFAAGLGFDF